MRSASLLLACALFGTVVTAGCDRTVEEKERTTTNGQTGQVTKDKTTVTESPNGTVTKDEKHEVSKP